MALTLNGTTGISGIDGSASAPVFTGTDSNTGVSFGSDILRLNTAGTTRATINDSGRFFVGSGTTAISSEMFLVTQSAFANYVATFNRTTQTDTAFRNHLAFAKSGTVVGAIKCKNNATQYNTSSDYRLKENISDVTDGITKIKQLKPRKFNFKNETGTFYDGFIAHEIQAVIPDCTSGTKDEVDENGNPVYQGMDYGRITPVLTAAIKELVARVETLETKVAALEAG